MLTVITVVTTIVWGISRADVAPTSPRMNRNSAQTSLQNQITRYQNFVKNMPSSISPDDQATLTTEINTTITHLQSRIDTMKNPSHGFATTTFAHIASTTRINSQLLMNHMSTTTRAEMKLQRIASQHKTASTTHAEMKVKSQARMKTVKDQFSADKLLSMKVNALIQAFRPVRDFTFTPGISPKALSSSTTDVTLSPTSSVSPDLIHSIITANSTSTLQSLIKDIPNQRKLAMQTLMKTKMLARQTDMKAKRLAMQDKMKLNKLATTTPEVATSTASSTEVTTGSTTLTTSTESTSTQTASVIDALPVASSTDTTASSTVASSTPDIASSTEVVASSTPEVASTTPEIIPEVIPDPAPVVEPVVPAPVTPPVVDPAPAVQTPAPESQP